jgi:hypothetical protein
VVVNVGKWVLRNLFLGFIQEEQRLQTYSTHDNNPHHIHAHGHSHGLGLVQHRGHPRSSSDSLSSGHGHRNEYSAKNMHSRSPLGFTSFSSPFENDTNDTYGHHSAGEAQAQSLPQPYHPYSYPSPIPIIPLNIALLNLYERKREAGAQGHGTRTLYPIVQSPTADTEVMTPMTESLMTPKPTGVGGGGDKVGAGAGSGLASSMTQNAGTDYFSMRRRPSTSHTASPSAQTPTAVPTTNANANMNAAPGSTPSVTIDDEFSGWGGPGSASAKSSTAHDVASSMPTTPGGTSSSGGNGFMGKLKSLGKGGAGLGSRKAASEGETSGIVLSPGTEQGGDEASVFIFFVYVYFLMCLCSQQTSSASTRTIHQRIQSQPLTPPTPHDAPHLTLPPHTFLMISREDAQTSSAGGWTPVYTNFTGSIASTPSDLEALEKEMPEWLMEYLLWNRVGAGLVPVVSKIGFVLLPWVVGEREREVYGETLPEMLNT